MTPTFTDRSERIHGWFPTLLGVLSIQCRSKTKSRDREQSYFFDLYQEIEPAVFQFENTSELEKPSMRTTLMFADWGLSDAVGENLKRFFIYINKPEKVDISDVLHVEGSCGSYLGANRGLGLTTEEGWKHTDVPGATIVCYHEGIGHAIGMPHSEEAMCVMGHAMYQSKVDDDPAILLADCILKNMISHSCLRPMMKRCDRWAGSAEFPQRFEEEDPGSSVWLEKQNGTVYAQFQKITDQIDSAVFERLCGVSAEGNRKCRVLLDAGRGTFILLTPSSAFWSTDFSTWNFLASGEWESLSL